MVDFKSSFIPQKPIVEGTKRFGERSRVSPLSVVGILAILLTLSAYGGIFGYRIVLQQQIKDRTSAIERIQERIDPKAIEDLKKFDRRLDAARNLLNQHVVLDRFFGFLESNTLQTVRFDRLGFTLIPGGTAELQMVGEARGYASLALQSDAFGEGGYMQVPIFSNLRLNNRGNVTFNFDATVDARLIRYGSTFDFGEVIGEATVSTETTGELPGTR